MVFFNRVPLIYDLSGKTRQILRNRIVNKPTRKTGKTPYTEYLKSEHWTNMRLECLARNATADGRLHCFTCGKPLTKQGARVHHLKYPEFIGDWIDAKEDLIPTCQKCHAIIHSVENGRLRRLV